MNFSLKPPLYALDTNQIYDLIYAQNIHNFIGNWLEGIEHFPIHRGFGGGSNTGLLLFERFTPWLDNWCKDYSTKLYEFYKYLSSSFYYNYRFFNGYGLIDYNYGDQLESEPIYNFNIPPSITLTNSTDKPISITYLEKSYKEDNIYFNQVYNSVEIYIKRIIRIDAFSSVQISTDNILFASMVLNSEDNLEPQEIGIPKGLNYLEIDDYLEEIKEIIDNNFPFLHQIIKQINYKVNCISGGYYDISTGDFTTELDYQFEYIPGTLILESVPNWYYSAAILYGNNDYWNSGETLKTDKGKELNVSVYQSHLEYDFNYIPNREEINSNSFVKTIIPNNLESDINEDDNFLLFIYKDGTGIHGASFREFAIDNNDLLGYFFSQPPFYYSERGIVQNPGLNKYVSFFHLKGRTGWTNTGICNAINPRLFSQVDGFVQVYNSLLVGSTIEADEPDIRDGNITMTTKHGVCRYVVNGTFQTTTNYLQLESEVEEQQITETYSGSLNEDDYRGYHEVERNSHRISWYQFTAETDRNLGGIFTKDNQRSHADYEVIKTLSFTTHTTDPRTIRNNTDQEIIDFVNNRIIPSYDDEEFMPDSLRIIEIHEALNAGKFANDPDDSEVYRFANLGYYIERIARVLGISVDPDGSIRSIRQRGFKESGETIPPGWPVGQWGRNQGGSDDGQIGGEPDHDRDGITYPVISNKYSLDPYTGKPDKIVEGGFVQCENLIQYLETFKDDLDKALGLQYAAANSFPRPQGDGDVSFEGLSILLQENTYMISQLSRLISSAQISSLVTQAVVSELLAHCGVPTTIKELKVEVGEGNEVSIPYPAITENSPSQFDQTLWLLSNLAPLLGGKINIRQDQRPEAS